MSQPQDPDAPECSCRPVLLPLPDLSLPNTRNYHPKRGENLHFQHLGNARSVRRRLQTVTVHPAPGAGKDRVLTATALLRAGSRGCCSIRWLRAAQLEKEIFLPLWESSRGAWLQHTPTPFRVAEEHNRQRLLGGTNCHPPGPGMPQSNPLKTLDFGKRDTAARAPGQPEANPRTVFSGQFALLSWLQLGGVPGGILACLGCLSSVFNGESHISNIMLQENTLLTATELISK